MTSVEGISSTGSEIVRFASQDAMNAMAKNLGTLIGAIEAGEKDIVSQLGGPATGDLVASTKH